MSYERRGSSHAEAPPAELYDSTFRVQSRALGSKRAREVTSTDVASFTARSDRGDGSLTNVSLLSFHAILVGGASRLNDKDHNPRAALPLSRTGQGSDFIEARELPIGRCAAEAESAVAWGVVKQSQG